MEAGLKAGKQIGFGRGKSLRPPVGDYDGLGDTVKKLRRLNEEKRENMEDFK